MALLLLAMSVASWVVILWKGWLLRRAARDLQLSTAAFWQAADLEDAQRRLGTFDAQQLVLPLLRAALGLNTTAPHTLAAAGDRSQQLTRVLRDALHRVLHRLQYGQVLLATVGSTAPFVGLLGTVWGIYNALTGIGLDGGFRIEQVSGPVGEALVMTAADAQHTSYGCGNSSELTFFGKAVFYKPHTRKKPQLRPGETKVAVMRLGDLGLPAGVVVYDSTEHLIMCNSVARTLTPVSLAALEVAHA